MKEVEINTNCLRSEAVTFISSVISLLIFMYMTTILCEGEKVSTFLVLLNIGIVGSSSIQTLLAYAMFPLLCTLYIKGYCRGSVDCWKSHKPYVIIQSLKTNSKLDRKVTSLKMWTVSAMSLTFSQYELLSALLEFFAILLWHQIYRGLSLKSSHFFISFVKFLGFPTEEICYHKESAQNLIRFFRASNLQYIRTLK